METKKYRFDEVTINFDKKRIPLSSAQREKRQGTFRYYGAQGVIDHVDDYIFDGTYLLIAEDGENLKSKKQNIAQVVDGQFWVNNHAHIVQGNEQCDTRFLCYLINSMDLSGYVTGSAQPKLSQANLNAVTLSLPTLAEQKRIVEYLYMLDQKIDVNRQINDNLEQQAMALYRQMFVENNNDARRESRADEYFDISIGKTPPRKEAQWFSMNPTDCIWVSISDMGRCGMYIADSSEHLTHESVDKFNIKVVPDNTVLLSFKLTVGRVAITDGAMVTNEAIAHFKTDKPEINEYLYCYLKDFNYQTMGSTSSIATAVNSKIIKAMPFVIPTDAELVSFHSATAPMFEMIKTRQRENTRLAELRDSLLPKLMSGEIDVSAVQL
ncbi:restriction endonuclease subunit S [Ruthenibacterium lactatiformans]|uniref:restriction endonuclease subunit S n=1 Tax=Ruthenibacterium lactatiformans TaxID=1550024 RepID=UPI00139573E4|nr:restriction endonuclease subunit S [Ruthenibacterium lactatiformans]MTS67722.1 restriction endonuclease subunit S [Ruthenibacterium lactatiformans]